MTVSTHGLSAISGDSFLCLPKNTQCMTIESSDFLQLIHIKDKLIHNEYNQINYSIISK